MILAQRRSWAVAGATVLLAAGLSGCGIQPTVVYVVGPAPSAANPSVNATASPETITSGQVYIYLLQNQGGTDQLIPVVRTIVGQKIDDASVAKVLIKGPTEDEVKEGLSTEVPSDLLVAPNAEGFGFAYTLSATLGAWAKAQFICTMQEFDQSQSVGYFYPGTQMTQVNWLACKDTTSQYIILPGLSADGQPYSGPAVPVPTKPGVILGK